MSARALLLFEGRLINPAAFSLIFAEGRSLCGITSGARVNIAEFSTDREARDGVVRLLAELERTMRREGAVDGKS